MPPVAPAPPAPAAGLGALGAAVVLRARMDIGVREDLGRNDGTRIREMMRPWKGVPGQNWCGFAASDWIIRGAADVGVEPPIAGSGGAQAIMAQFKAAKRWISASALRKDPSLLRAGMVPVWDRSDGTPAHQWWGHIGVTTGPAKGGAFPTIEGNSGVDGARVAEMMRALSDGRLFGVGVLD